MAQVTADTMPRVEHHHVTDVMADKGPFTLPEVRTPQTLQDPPQVRLVAGP